MGMKDPPRGIDALLDSILRVVWHVLRWRVLPPKRATVLVRMAFKPSPATLVFTNPARRIRIWGVRHAPTKTIAP